MFKVLKLKTGDMILCQFEKEITDFSYNPTLTLIDPITILTLKAHLENGGMTNEEIAIRPFLSLSDSVEYPINTDVIITMGDMKSEAKRIYIDYVANTKKKRQIEEDERKIIDLLTSLTPNHPLLIIEEPPREAPVPPPTA